MSVKTRLFGDGGNGNISPLYNAGDVIALSVFYISLKPFSDEQQFAQALIRMVRQSGKLPDIRITDKTIIRTRWESVMTSSFNIDERLVDSTLNQCLQECRNKLTENGEDPKHTNADCRNMTAKQVTISGEAFPIVNFAIAVKR